jgi:DNA-binding response OmpR family regulator
VAQILVVDDDPDLRGLVEFRLRKAGHQVLAAGDGASALAATLSASWVRRASRSSRSSRAVRT